MALRPASPKVRALQWLAQREHSRAELRTKLLRLLARAEAAGGALGDQHADAAEAEAQVDQLLDWLTNHGYLSQQRFIESRVHAREQRFGTARIQQELQQHGVALDASALQGLKDSEFDRARELWRRRYGSAGAPADAATKLRQMRFLTGRGFALDVVRRVLRETGIPGDD